MDNSTSKIFIELDKNDQTSSNKFKLLPVKLEDFVNAIAFNTKYNNKDIVKIKLNDRDLQNLVQIDSSEIDTPRNKNMMNDQIFTIASFIGEMDDANTRKSKRKSKIDSSRSVDRFENAKSRVDSRRKSQRRSDKSRSSKSKLDTSITIYKDCLDYNYYTDEPSKTAIRGSDLSWQSVEDSRKQNSSNHKSFKRSSSRIKGKYISIYPDRSSRERRKSSRSRGKKEKEHSDEHDHFTVIPDSPPEKLIAETGTSTDQSSGENVIKYSKEVGISTDDKRKQRYTNKCCKDCRQHCEFCFCHAPYTKIYSEREYKCLKCGCWDCDIYGIPTQRKKKPGLLDRICRTLMKPKCHYNDRVYNGPEKIPREDYRSKEFNLQRPKDKNSLKGKDEAENKIICDSCIVTAYTTPVIDKTGKLHLVLNKQGHPI